MTLKLPPPGGAFVFDAYGTLIQPGQMDIVRSVMSVLNPCLKSGIVSLSYQELSPMVITVRAGEFCGESTPAQAWHSLLTEILRRRQMMPANLFACRVTELVTALALADLNCYSRARLMPGARALVNWVQQSGFRAVLCSNATQAGLATLHRLGLLEMFRPGDIAVSCLLRRHKNPDDYRDSLFAYVADPDGLGVDANTAVVLEDEPSFLEIAARVGYRNLALTTQNWPDPLGSPPLPGVIVVSSLLEFIRTLTAQI